MRRSFVQIDGQLYEKAGDNSIVINGVIWRCYSGRWAPEGTFEPASYTVMPDIKPYTSMIDGSEITSRSHHRAHLKAHGCIEVGNEYVRPKEGAFEPAKGLREELRARINN